MPRFDDWDKIKKQMLDSHQKQEETFCGRHITFDELVKNVTTCNYKSNRENSHFVSNSIAKDHKYVSRFTNSRNISTAVKPKILARLHAITKNFKISKIITITIPTKGRNNAFL